MGTKPFRPSGKLTASPFDVTFRMQPQILAPTVKFLNFSSSTNFGSLPLGCLTYLCPGSGGKGGDWDMFLEIMRGFLWWDHVCIVPMRVVWDRVWPPASNDQG